MQQQFLIESGNDFDAGASVLALLVGQDYLTYAVFDAEENKLVSLARCKFEGSTAENLDAFLQEREGLHQGFQKIVTAFDFDVNTLLPVDMNTGDNTALLYLNKADQQDHVINEVIGDWQVANVYSVPYALLNKVLTYFPSSRFWHVQSVYIKNAVCENPFGCLYVDFGNKQFNVTVAKEGKLLLSKSYRYKIPADALFYLLKICESFDLSQETVQLKVSGLVDRSSGIYRVLYEYFLNIDLVAASWEQDDTYPAHYFTLLNQLSLCE